MKKISWFQRLLWSIAGAEVSILEQDDCRTDHKKYSAIGSAILVTTFWAFCSGALAAWFFTQRTVPIQDESGTDVIDNNTIPSYSVSDTIAYSSAKTNASNSSQKKVEKSNGSFGAALAFGIIWAILIFCIDRCLVITLKKDPTLEKQKWLVPFSIRFVLALVIAFMMSIPLELFLFKDFIEVKTLDYDEFHVSNFGKRIEAGIEADSLGKEIKDKQKVLDRLYYTDSIERANIESKKKQLDEWRRKREAPVNSTDYVAADNKCKTLLEPYKKDTNYYYNGRWILYPDGYKEASNDRARAKNAWETKCDDEINRLTEQYKVDTAAHNKTSKSISSKETILARNESDMATADKERKEKQLDKEYRLQKTNHFIRNFEILNWAVRPSNNDGWLYFFLLNLIRFIFFMIELLPTIVKIWTRVGNYDRKVHSEELQMIAYLESSEYADAMKRMHNMAAETQEKILKMQQKLELELKEDVLRNLKEAQDDIAKKSIDKWHKKEIEKLDNSL